MNLFERKNCKVVATLTTLPDRYDLLSKTIESLVTQDYYLDAIYITLPKRTKRFNTIYSELPDTITKHSNVNIVRINKDYGPITKLLGGLKMEKDPNTIIISVDDDIIYPSNLVSRYLELSTDYPDEVICGAGLLYYNSILESSVIHNNNNITTFNNLLGFNIPKDGRLIDIIFGIGGVLYKRKFFPEYSELYNEILKYSENDINTFLNDDVMISGYLSKKGINKRIFKNSPYILNQNNDGPKLSSNILKMAKSMDESIEYLIHNGFFLEMTNTSINDSALYRIIVIILFIIIILILFYYFYIKNKHDT